MGMDVYGNDPLENKPLSEFPVLEKYKDMDFKEKGKDLDSNEKLRTKYWKEQDAYDDINVGSYFRNNCWWWRPLWDYCKWIAPELISDELWELGHNNNGAGLDDAGAKELGSMLIKSLDDGTAEIYVREHRLDAEQKEKAGDKWATSYPIDLDNIERFARFCLECGGFEIN